VENPVIVFPCLGFSEVSFYFNLAFELHKNYRMDSMYRPIFLFIIKGEIGLTCYILAINSGCWDIENDTLAEEHKYELVFQFNTKTGRFDKQQYRYTKIK
jgi:hypothetical protein